VKIIKDIATLRAQTRNWKAQNMKIGLVPTMGFFHDGHLALIKEAKSKSDKTVVSIFVNPRQFGPQEDLDKYPRDIERDTELARSEGVDLLFYPAVETMYPEGYQTSVSVSLLSGGLCGASRPGHFDGVATVVAKLFNLVQADIVIFGEKDFQQLALIRRMVLDLNFPVEIIGHPIVREKDGLAMSSRNKYLSGQERIDAVSLYKTLQYAAERVAEQKQIEALLLIEELQEMLQKTPGCRVDYVSIVHPQTLTPQTIAEQGNILALAVYFNNKVRLIDNITL
jgi:pantoate--beta-alanine ligase